MSAVTVALFTLIWEVAMARKICFDEIGCLSLSSPWVSPTRRIPDPLPPKELPIRLDLFSRENPDGLLDVDLRKSPMKPSRPTVVITHDHDDDGNALWMRSLKDAYLEQVDANVVIMDWSSGTVGFQFDQATANIRVIGAVMAGILRESVRAHGLEPKGVHLIGEGLGAHLMGYIAKELQLTGRITGLDPSREFFEYQDSRIRLDKNDANFVDVIHTSVQVIVGDAGLGLSEPIGHVDFYVNIGEHQPGCEPINPDPGNIDVLRPWITWDDTTKSHECNHKRARDYFLQAVWHLNNCTFWGHKINIDSVVSRVLQNLPGENLRVGQTALCTPFTCTPLGLKTGELPGRGVFYVKTRKTSPYCMGAGQTPTSQTIFLGMVNSITTNLSKQTTKIKEIIAPS